MRAYTERGLRETSGGLREARAVLAHRISALQAQAGIIEAELSALGKIDAALSLAAEVVTREQRTREEEAGKP